MVVIESPATNEPKRKRYAPKVRSGCTSCKKAKVKCPENRPKCRRCVRLGFSCEYKSPKPWLFEPSKEAPGVRFQVKESGHEAVHESLTPNNLLFILEDFRSQTKPTLMDSSDLKKSQGLKNDKKEVEKAESRSLNQRRILPHYQSISTLAISWDEAEVARSMQYYLYKTGPLMSMDSDPYLFTVLLPQRSWHHPAVKHSIVAASMMSETVIELRGGSAPSTHRANHHYHQAVSAFLRSPPTMTVALLLCVMLITYERYNTNHKAALMHMESAAKMLLQCKNKGSSDVVDDKELIDRHITPAFARCFQYAGLDKELSSPILTDFVRNNLPKAENSFPSFEDACDRLATCTNMLRLWNPEYTSAPDFSGICVQLDEWFETFKGYKGAGWPCEHLLLQVHYNVAVAMLGLQQGVKPGSNDLVNISKIVDHMDYLLSSTSIQSSTMFKSRLGIIPPLFFAAVESDETKVNARAIYLLRTIRRVEGSWTSIQAAAIAQNIVNTEKNRFEVAQELTEPLGTHTALSYLTQNYGYQRFYGSHIGDDRQSIVDRDLVAGLKVRSMGT